MLGENRYKMKVGDRDRLMIRMDRGQITRQKVAMKMLVNNLGNQKGRSVVVPGNRNFRCSWLD